MKKNTDPQTEKHAKTKHKRQEPAQNWGPIVRGALAELSRHSWLQNFLIGLALLLVWPLVGVTVMKTYRATIIGFGIGITLLVWIGVFIFLHQAKDSDGATPPTPPAPNSDRAYVVVSKGYLTEPPNTGNYPIATLEFENTGKTPATNVRVSVNYSRIKDKGREDAEKGIMPNITQNPFESVAVLGAGKIAKFSTRNGKWENSEVQKLWVEGRFVQYLWGEVYYDDIQGNKHVTHFCLHGEGPESHRLVFCLHGNWMENTDKEPPERPNQPTKPISRELTPEELAGPPRMGSGSGAPSITWQSHYPRFKWTDYTEDYFHDAIWRWKYRPEMGNNDPRDIRPSCPECDSPLRKIGGTGKIDPDKGRTVSFQCGQHIRLYHFQSPSYDDFDGIRALILEKLQNGEWEEVVKRQYDARRGIV